MLSISLVFSLLVCFAYFAYRVKNSPFNKINFPLIIEGDPLITADNEIGFVATPNGVSKRTDASRNLDFSIYNNSRSARINHPSDTVPKKVDLLTVGGSFAWGHGLENEETFTEVVGKANKIDVANFSFGSYGTVQSLQFLQRNIDLQPKLVIYAFIEDLLRRNLSPCAPNY